MTTLLKVAIVFQWVTGILGGFHINSALEKNRTLMLGFSNCFCGRNALIHQMLLNYHHLTRAALSLRFLKLRFANQCHGKRPKSTGTPSQFLWSSDVQTSIRVSKTTLLLRAFANLLLQVNLFFNNYFKQTYKKYVQIEKVKKDDFQRHMTMNRQLHKVLLTTLLL